MANQGDRASSDSCPPRTHAQQSYAGNRDEHGQEPLTGKAKVGQEEHAQYSRRAPQRP